MALKKTTVKTGQDWNKLANQYGVSASELIRANPSILKLSAGNTVTIPQVKQQGWGYSMLAAPNNPTPHANLFQPNAGKTPGTVKTTPQNANPGGDTFMSIGGVKNAASPTASVVSGANNGYQNLATVHPNANRQGFQTPQSSGSYVPQTGPTGVPPVGYGPTVAQQGRPIQSPAPTVQPAAPWDRAQAQMRLTQPNGFQTPQTSNYTPRQGPSGTPPVGYGPQQPKPGFQTPPTSNYTPTPKQPQSVVQQGYDMQRLGAQQPFGPEYTVNTMTIFNDLNNGMAPPFISAEELKGLLSVSGSSDYAQLDAALVSMGYTRDPITGGYFLVGGMGQQGGTGGGGGGGYSPSGRKSSGGGGGNSVGTQPQAAGFVGNGFSNIGPSTAPVNWRKKP